MINNNNNKWEGENNTDENNVFLFLVIVLLSFCFVSELLDNKLCYLGLLSSIKLEYMLDTYVVLNTLSKAKRDCFANCCMEEHIPHVFLCMETQSLTNLTFILFFVHQLFHQIAERSNCTDIGQHECLSTMEIGFVFFCLKRTWISFSTTVFFRLRLLHI